MAVCYCTFLPIPPTDTQTLFTYRTRIEILLLSLTSTPSAFLLTEKLLCFQLSWHSTEAHTAICHCCHQQFISSTASVRRSLRPLPCSQLLLPLGALLMSMKFVFASLLFFSPSFPSFVVLGFCSGEAAHLPTLPTNKLHLVPCEQTHQNQMGLLCCILEANISISDTSINKGVLIKKKYQPSVRKLASEASTN